MPPTVWDPQHLHTYWERTTLDQVRLFNVTYNLLVSGNLAASKMWSQGVYEDAIIYVDVDLSRLYDEALAFIGEAEDGSVVLEVSSETAAWLELTGRSTDMGHAIIAYTPGERLEVNRVHNGMHYTLRILREASIPLTTLA